MIIFINGSINTGKSTISRILSKELPRVALIEVDKLRGMIEWMPLEEAMPINLENTVALTRNFSKNGLNIIVEYPLLQRSYDYLTNELKDLNKKIYFFTLAPKIEIALTNRGSRDLNNWERDRIKRHYDKGMHQPNFGDIIDNSEQSPEETAKIILDKIKNYAKR